MLSQNFSQSRQHIHKRRVPFMRVPWHSFRQQRWLGNSAASIPCLRQHQQHHRQRSLAIDRLTAPALRLFKTHMLFRLQYSFFNSPPVVIPLYDFGIRHRRNGAKEEIVFLFSRRISNYDHANGNIAVDVIPQACYPQYQMLGLITLFVNRYLPEALLAIGSRLSWTKGEATPLLSRGKFNRQHLTISLILAYNALELKVLRVFFISGHINVLANRSVASKEKAIHIFCGSETVTILAYLATAAMLPPAKVMRCLESRIRPIL